MVGSPAQPGQYLVDQRALYRVFDDSFVHFSHRLLIAGRPSTILSMKSCWVGIEAGGCTWPVEWAEPGLKIGLGDASWPVCQFGISCPLLNKRIQRMIRFKAYCVKLLALQVPGSIACDGNKFAIEIRLQNMCSGIPSGVYVLTQHQNGKYWQKQDGNYFDII